MQKQNKKRPANPNVSYFRGAEYKRGDYQLNFETFPDNLNNVLKERKIAPGNVAQNGGVERATMCTLVNRKSGISLKTFIKLMNAMPAGIKFEDLFK